MKYCTKLPISSTKPNMLGIVFSSVGICSSILKKSLGDPEFSNHCSWFKFLKENPVSRNLLDFWLADWNFHV